MSDHTIHTGSDSNRGIYIALVVLVAFILGIAFLGSRAGPDDTGAAPAVEEAVPAVEPTGTLAPTATE